jgi:hypothetical protein
MFKVSREWIDQFCTEAGGWTRDQLEVIGIEWPPIKGWKAKAIGRELTDEQRLRFESRIPAKEVSAPESDAEGVRSDFRKLVRMILSKRHHYGELVVEAEDLQAKHGL